jgi:hypothetical protein
MKHALYFFNPEHDLALANNDLNFNAPAPARQLASDLLLIPVWFAPDGSGVAGSGESNEWLQSMQMLFPQLSNTKIYGSADFKAVSSIVPWGWDAALCKQISPGTGDSKTLDELLKTLLPNELQLKKIRDLSHRRTAIRALRYLHAQTSLRGFLPHQGQEISNIEMVKNYSAAHAQAIFKAPWSGSGKGLSWVRNGLTDSHLGWCRNIIAKQGSVIGEPIYPVVQDFAMEFSCTHTKVSFAGYSLFETEKGIYRSNLLMRDDAIFEQLTGKFIPPELLLSVQNHLLQFIETEIAPHYTGMLGVDMFVYTENGKFKLHPCVEINLRMTMGCVARIFYDRFVHPEAKGHFYVDHYPAAGQLWNDHLQRKAQLPLSVENGKITAGYLALTDVRSSSHYRIRVEIL